MRTITLSTLNMLFTISPVMYRLTKSMKLFHMVYLIHHIVTFSSFNAVETEFEMFYQNILSNILNISETNWHSLKRSFKLMK